jgi:hypothetical protein
LHKPILNRQNAPVATISLAGLGNIAQIVIAATGVFAFFGVAYQIHVTRLNERRTRVYAYAERFKQLEAIEAAFKWRAFWKDHSYAEWTALEDSETAQWLTLANLVEEVGALYDRKLIDRDVVAETLGVHFEGLWRDCLKYVMGVREAKNNPWLFDYWEQMQAHTPRRRAKAKRKITRRRRLRELVRGD